MTKLPRLVGNDASGHYMAVYDAWNRLVKLQSDETTPPVYATMAYDGRGRRIWKTVDTRLGVSFPIASGGCRLAP